MSEIDRILREFDGISDETRMLMNKISSRQRHDFMNMLQVITGYLQIDWHDKAVNTALEYGQKTESIGRLQKHGLTMGSQVVEYYVKIFSNNERKIEIVNSLPPTEQILRRENRDALKMLDEIFGRCSKATIEMLLIHFDLIDDQILVRVLVPETDVFEFMDLVLIYKDRVRKMEAGVVNNDGNWDFIEFLLTE